MKKELFILLFIISVSNIYCENMIDIDGIWESVPTFRNGLKEYLAIKKINESTYFVINYDPSIKENCFAEVGFYNGEYIEVQTEESFFYLKLPLSDSSGSFLKLYPTRMDAGSIFFKRLNAELNSGLSEEEELQARRDFAHKFLESQKTEKETGNE